MVKATSSPRVYEPRLARRSSGDEAALLIRRMIFDGELRPGERVPQDDVAAMLGISRIPVREALIALEREGWVTIEMHRGAFVNALDARSVRDHYELFGLVYGFAARLAIARSGPELVDRLAELLAACDGTDDPVEFGRCASAFQATVVDSGQSSGIGADSLALTVYDKNSVLYKQVPESLLQGGNVVIHPAK